MSLTPTAAIHGASGAPYPSASDTAAERVLTAVEAREPVVLVDSPPGAGKTRLVTQVAAFGAGVLGERVAIATQTNRQAFDVARRLALAYPVVPVVLFVRDGLPVPRQIETSAGVLVVRRQRDLPTGACVMVANSAKWASVRNPPPSLNLLVVDEAYQLTNAGFARLSGLAGQHVLVGDPGQIEPVVAPEIDRWKGEPDGPHVRAPEALLAMQPSLRTERLPLSWRLPQSTVDVVQPAFYADMPFAAGQPSGTRSLLTTPASGSRFDPAITEASAGESLVGVALPPKVTGERDPELAQAIVDLLVRLVLGRDGHVQDEHGVRPVEARDIGVVCAHVSQVADIRRRLPAFLRGVLVETADRLQGLERDIVVVHHPLSGRTTASPFLLDSGRLCVMLSRHRVACFVVCRAGSADAMTEQQGVDSRYFGDHARRPNALVSTHRLVFDSLAAGLIHS